MRIESDEIAIHTAAEDHISGSRKHAALGVIDHLEFPFFRAGLRIKSLNRAISFVFGFVVGYAAAGTAGAAR